jgi:hypothetical protein
MVAGGIGARSGPPHLLLPVIVPEPGLSFDRQLSAAERAALAAHALVTISGSAAPAPPTAARTAGARRAITRQTLARW